MEKNYMINEAPARLPVGGVESSLPWHYWSYCVPGGNPSTGPTAHCFYTGGGLAWYTQAASAAFHQLVGSPTQQGDVIYLDQIQDNQYMPPYGPYTYRGCWVYLGSGNHFNHAQFLPVLTVNTYTNFGTNVSNVPGAITQCEVCDNMVNATSWDCVQKGDHPKFGFKCIEIQGTGGQYPTKQDCLRSGNCIQLNPDPGTLTLNI
tara:strand:- start:96 stop:707 length:612 start_codon:yes stop_codon:yes gene_type:complete